MFLFFLTSLTSIETVIKVIASEHKDAACVEVADCSLGLQRFQENLLSRPPPASMERSDEISVLERQNVISLLRYFHGK